MLTARWMIFSRGKLVSSFSLDSNLRFLPLPGLLYLIFILWTASSDVSGLPSFFSLFFKASCKIRCRIRIMKKNNYNLCFKNPIFQEYVKYIVEQFIQIVFNSHNLKGLNPLRRDTLKWGLTSQFHTDALKDTCDSKGLTNKKLIW